MGVQAREAPASCEVPATPHPLDSAFPTPPGRHSCCPASQEGAGDAGAGATTLTSRQGKDKTGARLRHTPDQTTRQAVSGTDLSDGQATRQTSGFRGRCTHTHRPAHSEGEHNTGHGRIIHVTISCCSPEAYWSVCEVWH